MGSKKKWYSLEEEKAMLDYIKKHGKETGQHSVRGNALYKDMEKKKITCHPWQSMRSKCFQLLEGENARFQFRQLISSNTYGKAVTVLTSNAAAKKKHDKSTKSRSLNQVTKSKKEGGKTDECVLVEGAQNPRRSPRKRIRRVLDEEDEIEEIDVPAQNPRPSRVLETSLDDPVEDSDDECTDNEDADTKRLKRSPRRKARRYQGLENRVQVHVDASAQSPRRSQRLEVRNEEIHEDSDNDGNNNEEIPAPSPRRRKRKMPEKEETHVNKAVENKTVHEESEELLEYFKTEEGEKRFRMMIFEDEVSELMVSLGKTYRDVFQAIYWGSGLIEEAEHILKNQTMIDGSQPWNPDDDQILIVGKEKDVNELIKRRGMDAVTQRVNFLT
ncbi:uncharacterized protein LOC135686032 isoform X2 [Rhopilema esculentum]|uniref:uncharacterized protein LOC135686032 isoform X2 n=1 Tax=Rhopilema esculentum TaxID=499914 RepID=UPI0031D3082B